MFGSRPAARLLLPYGIGIYLGWSCAVSFLHILFIVLILFILALVFGKHDKPAFTRNVLLILLCVGFGMLKITCDLNMTADNNVSRFSWPETSVSLKGVISDEPSKSDYSVRFIVDAESVVVGNRPVIVTGRILVSYRITGGVNPDAEAFRCGVRVSLNGQMAGLGRIRNPGEFDYGSYLRLNDIDSRFFADNLDSACVTGIETAGIFSKLVYPVRRSLLWKIDRLIGGDEANFLRGLLVGERSDIPLEIKTAFINSGVMHIVAVSGLHVVLVAAMIVMLLQFFRLPGMFRSFIAGVLLVYYAILTGGTPSVVRSVIMAILYLAAGRIQRKADLFNVLSVSALIILLIDSRQLFHPGFQLSFVSILSIVVLYPRLNIFSRRLQGKSRIKKILASCWNLFAVSVSAAIGTGPFVSVYFGKISVIGVIANIIIVPLSNMVLAVGMITVGISYISMSIASVYGEVTRMLTKVMLDLVQMFGDLPFACFPSNLSWYSSLVFYAIVGLFIMMIQKRSRKKAFIYLLVLMNVIIYENIFARRDNILRVAFLDVGQGDAIVVELPGGENLIVDTGPASLISDAGDRVILPYLRVMRIGLVNRLIVTHPDADHIGGCKSLLRGVEIDKLLDGGYNPRGEMQIQLDQIADSIKINRSTLRRGMICSGCSLWRLYVLHPGGGCESYHGNEQSVVVRIVYGSTSVLLAGDIHAENEMELIRIFGDLLKSDILKLAHHGSASSSSAEFLRVVKPRLGIISVGKRNRFNHPAPEVMDRLSGEQCSYYRTDEEGALIFESDGKTWIKCEWR